MLCTIAIAVTEEDTCGDRLDAGSSVIILINGWFPSQLFTEVVKKKVTTSSVTCPLL